MLKTHILNHILSDKIFFFPFLILSSLYYWLTHLGRLSNEPTFVDAEGFHMVVRVAAR